MLIEALGRRARLADELEASAPSTSDPRFYEKKMALDRRKQVNAAVIAIESALLNQGRNELLAEHASTKEP